MSRASSLCFAIGTDHLHKQYHRVAIQRAPKTHFGLWPPPVSVQSTDGHREGLLIAGVLALPSLFLSFFSLSFLYHSLFVCFLLSVSVPLSLSPSLQRRYDLKCTVLKATNCLQTLITKRATKYNALWRDTLYVEQRQSAQHYTPYHLWRSMNSTWSQCNIDASRHAIYGTCV